MFTVGENELALLSHKDQIRFGLFCCYQIQKDWEMDMISVSIVKAIEMWLENQTIPVEYKNIADHIEFGRVNLYYRIAIAHVFKALTYPSEFTVYTTSHIAVTKACINNNIYWPRLKQEVISNQWKYYDELKNFDQIAEQILLGE